jgi:4-diphosphocytidyl-2-C-methyl-D-erythritol kinase
MAVSVRSFAKINLGLRIGPKRDDGFHELRTLYQTIALHDLVRVEVARGTGIEIRSKHPHVPCDESNTCHRIAERVVRLLKVRGRVVVTIEKNLPVQGGLGAASSNAVAALLGLERALKQQISPEEKLRIAAEVGSDLPLFLLGGAVVGAGRGEEVYTIPDLPQIACVVALPLVAVSTPRAFADWDEQFSGSHGNGRLTVQGKSDTINEFHRLVFAALGAQNHVGFSSGVPAGKRGDRAEALLLDLVRTGIENDFERVVFPQHPELRDIKRVLERQGAEFASLSGSGSAIYGLFKSKQAAEEAARYLQDGDIAAQSTSTLTRKQYWERLWLK